MGKVNIDNLKINKKLGAGMLGTVYLATDENKNKYALKIEHILKKDLEKDTSSKIWREILFIKEMSKIPNHFMKLYDYKFSEQCTHIQKYGVPLDIFPDNMQAQFKKLAESPYCIIKVFDLKGGSIGSLFDSGKLSQNQIYSMIIQITYAISIMMKYRYIHGDLHDGNITYTKTDKKTITINNQKVPTFGYIYSIIDYGEVLSDKFKLSKLEKQRWKWNQQISEISSLVEMLVDTSRFWKFMNKNKIKPDWKNIHKQFNKQPEYEIIKKFNVGDRFAMNLFAIFFPKVYQQVLSGTDKYFEFKYLIPKGELLYIMINVNEPKKIIDYFMNKIKS
jgi:hypothetical protein